MFPDDRQMAKDYGLCSANDTIIVEISKDFLDPDHDSSGDIIHK